VGTDCRIHESVKMTGKIFMGADCAVQQGAVLAGPLVLGSQCRIGPGAVVKDSVLWDRVTVGSHASVRGCAIANDCVIGAEADLMDAVLGDHILIPPASKPEPGTRLFPEGVEGAP
jgi:NDP-sugar pyrophosphorylase family protein